MKKVNRRRFIKNSLQGIAAISVGTATENLLASVNKDELSNNRITVVIPMPIQVVIDDVGWWSGEDGSKRQEPYRTGIDRNHVAADYRAIVDLGRQLGIRPQAAMVLCEWDKNNILRKYPTSTWMGKNWDNSKWVGPWLEEAADIIRNNEEYFEFTIHGVGHEYWTGGTFTRAEWADNDGTMRQREQVEIHLDCFEEIMNQHQLGYFPRSFVPTAFRHGFGVTGDHKVSMAELLKQRGVTYINTPFVIMQNSDAVKHNYFGFDAGVMTIDRGNDLLDWNIINTVPTGELQGPVCGMHWPNLLHKDPERNSEIVKGWVKLLAPYNEKVETMLAPNSVVFQHQLAHHICTETSLSNDGIELDFSETDTLPGFVGKNELVLKLKSNTELGFTSDSIKIISESLKIRDEFNFYTLQLKRIVGYNKARCPIYITRKKG